MNEKDYDPIINKLVRTRKYQNINIELQLKQQNRFNKLFPKGKEVYMHLILRSMNAYCLFVKPFYAVYQNSPIYKQDILNFIFDPSFSNFSYYLTNSNLETIPDEILIENDNDEFLDVSDDETKDYETSPDDLAKLSAQTDQTANYYTWDRSFFDFHFERCGENVFFRCFYDINQLSIVSADSNAYEEAIKGKDYSSANYISEIISPDMYNFIDEVMNAAYTAYPPFKGIPFWTPDRRKFYHNYISNFGIQHFFQSKKYNKFLVRFGKDFYSWECDEHKKFNLISHESTQMEDEFVHIGRFEINNHYFDYSWPYCAGISFYFYTKSKKPKPDKDLIKTHLKFYTMNNADVLNALALDFVNSILIPPYLHKNTIVSGDYDKFYKWSRIFNPVEIAKSNIMTIYPIDIPTEVRSLTGYNSKEIAHTIKYYSRGMSSLRFTHRYFLISPDSELSARTEELVNSIDFPYGGEYYNLKPLGNAEVLEITKLLLIHGWHLLNSDNIQKPVMEPQNNHDVFMNNLEKTVETRIPLNTLHKIYCKFVDSGKNITDLRKELEEKGFKYENKRILVQDHDYFKELISQCDKHFLELDINENNPHRSIYCKLSLNFWNEISLERKKENEEKRSAEFDLYLQTLSEKYSGFFVEPNTYVPNEDPYKDYIPIEKIPDSKLQ